MPLPKSASIAARATEVYSETWSVVLQKCWGVPPVMEDELADIYQLLPYLRQLLTCCACAGLLEDAMISLVCGHCYCYQCQFRAPLLKIQCRQCRERRGLVIEAQLRLLVDCYKRMCLILASQLDSNPLVLSIEGSNPSNYGGGDGEILKNISDKESSEAQVKSRLAASEGFNPITEILKEVQEGTKVSRAVLVVKPPSKYMNAKLMATPKKEPSLTAKVTASLTTDKPEKEAENKSPLEVEPAEEVPKKKRSHKTKRKLSLDAPFGTKEGSAVNQKTAKEVTKGRRKEDSSPVPSTKATFVTHYELTKAKLAVDNLRPVKLEVSLKSLDNHVVRVTSDGISIKDTFDKNGKKREQYSKSTLLKYVRFQLDKEGNRKRAWNPLCPRVVVRRSRASIDKMRNLQTRTVGAKLRSKERKKKTSTPPLDHPVVKAGKKSRQTESIPQPSEKVDHQKTLEQLEREHGLELPDIDTDIDPDLELDASWLEQLCEGIDEEDLMYFSQPPMPGPPPPAPPPHPMSFPPSPTPPHHAPMFGPPYSPRPHLPPHPHHFSPHHPPPPGFMHPLLGPPPPPPHPHPFMPRHHPLPPPIHHPPRPHPLPPSRPPPPIRIHPPTSPQTPVFPSRSKHQLPVIVGKLNIGKSSGYTPAKLSTGQSSKAKKRRSPGYSESGWRCRCGTNNVMFPEKVCAKGKCPCFSKGIPCKNCLCRHCHNPFNNSEGEETEESEQMADETENMDVVV